jgi:hypothetical protein
MRIIKKTQQNYESALASKAKKNNNFTGNLSHYTVHKKLKSSKYTLNEAFCFFF